MAGKKRPITKERLLAKVKIDWNGCWIWQHATNERYGVWAENGKNQYAHRMSYELYKGKIPEGLTIDHLCSVPLCVNPDHLEAVYFEENNRRSSSISAKNAVKTHCKSGHPFTDENTWIEKTGSRHCRTCHRNTEALRRSKIMERADA